MKKRLICALLAALMILGLVPGMATQASAASAMTMSEQAIAVLKEFEGFLSMAVRDNGQYSIGYGSACEAGEYPNGITEEEADALMRKYLTDMEKCINKLADDYSLTFTQNQFDALMLFTYNVGGGWTTTDSDFRTAVIEGKTGNDFIYYISRWCTASGDVLPGLVTRRLAEADLYLNGYYSTKAPDFFTYVQFDANGGACDSRIQGYDATQPVKIRPMPAYTGYRFLGWYTEVTGGKWISHLDNTTKGLTLYAHWQKDEGTLDEDGSILGQEVSYTRTASKELTVYTAPGGEAGTGKVAENASIAIVADYIEANGTKWGKLASGGWVELTNTTVKLTAAQATDRPASGNGMPSPEDTTTFGVEVTITGNTLIIRSGPGTDYAIKGSLTKGKKVTITETTDVDGVLWGKCSLGWICLTYTNYDAVVEDDGKEETVIATGTVTASALCIRSGTGTNYDALGTLAKGTKVSIIETEEVAGTTWGKISKGWICMTYVKLDEAETPEQPETPETPEQPETPETPDTSDATTGTVTASALCIRSGAGTNYGILGTLPKGTKVTITEEKTVSGTIWGKMEKGWICMTYVKRDTSVAEPDTDPEEPAKTGTGVVTASSLCVRSGPGIGFAPMKALPRGTEVTITQTQMVNGTPWGKIDGGWICMTYVKLDSTTPDEGTEGGGTEGGTEGGGTEGGDSTGGTTEPAEPITGVVTASFLCVRSGPGTDYAPMKSLPRDTKITILETKLVKGVIWGKIDGGWVSMSYVKLDTESGSVTITGTVTASSLCIRTAAGPTGAILGTYWKGETVEILETTNVNGTIWGRTERGWICMTYVK